MGPPRDGPTSGEVWEIVRLRQVRLRKAQEIAIFWMDRPVAVWVGSPRDGYARLWGDERSSQLALA